MKLNAPFTGTVRSAEGPKVEKIGWSSPCKCGGHGEGALSPGSTDGTQWSSGPVVSAVCTDTLITVGECTRPLNVVTVVRPSSAYEMVSEPVVCTNALCAPLPCTRMGCR